MKNCCFENNSMKWPFYVIQTQTINSEWSGKWTPSISSFLFHWRNLFITPGWDTRYVQMLPQRYVLTNENPIHRKTEGVYYVININTNPEINSDAHTYQNTYKQQYSQGPECKVSKQSLIIHISAFAHRTVTCLLTYADRIIQLFWELEYVNRSIQLINNISKVTNKCLLCWGTNIFYR